MGGVAWPAALQQLRFGFPFNQPIEVLWPAALQELAFRKSAWENEIMVMWPSSLQKLTFDGAFNQPIDRMV